MGAKEFGASNTRCLVISRPGGCMVWLGAVTGEFQSELHGNLIDRGIVCQMWPNLFGI